MQYVEEQTCVCSMGGECRLKSEVVNLVVLNFEPQVC